jgi:K+-transporting ATPase ATPase C chain
MRTLYRSTIMTLALAVILCGVYPLAVTVVAKVFFPSKSSGGILYRDGKPVGARLIGQGFSKPEYFHGRPSAAGDKGYDAANSSGSNLGPTSAKLKSAVEANVKSVLAENPGLKKGEIPVDLVTTSGSGLDPHISPEGAAVQVERVAKLRGIPTDKVREAVDRHTEGRQLGFLGEPVVNVLELNLDLDSMGRKP